MTYEQALTEYVAARDHLAQWTDRPGPAADVTQAEHWLTQAALTLAEKTAEREGR
jgi:hypothetical protein